MKIRNLGILSTMLCLGLTWQTEAMEMLPDGSCLLSGFEDHIDTEWGSNVQNKAAFERVTTNKYVKEGKSSGKWAYGMNPWLFLNEVPSDWSEFEGITFWLYSEEKNGQMLNITMTSGDGYYFHQIKIDWKGWEKVVIPLEKNKGGPANCRMADDHGFAV